MAISFLRTGAGGRCHFYTEVARVKKGVEAWKAGNLTAFGKAVFESGHSSITNYESGSPELRALHEIARKTDGVYGGRFSGAGFKGCYMAITHPAYRALITKRFTNDYLQKIPGDEGPVQHPLLQNEQMV